MVLVVVVVAKQLISHNMHRWLASVLVFTKVQKMNTVMNSIYL